MAGPATQRFVDAVCEPEASGRVEPMLAGFDPAATLSNLAVHVEGEDKAHRFRTACRGRFSDISSEAPT